MGRPTWFGADFNDYLTALGPDAPVKSLTGGVLCDAEVLLPQRLLHLRAAGLADSP